MRVQEVAVWSNPTVSIIWVVLSQILLYYLCNWTTSLVSTLSYLLLSVYVYLTWVYTVWPAVRVPASEDEDCETWTPLHPDVLSAPELQTFLSNLKSKINEVSMEANCEPTNQLSIQITYKNTTLSSLLLLFHRAEIK